MDFYYFKKESMCRQDSIVRLLLSNMSCQSTNTKDNKRFWKELADTTISYT